MSTAGKVLVVLGVLMTAVWTILMASVAQLNMNANKRLNDIETQIVKVKAEVEEVRKTADDNMSKINDEHVAKQRDMRLVNIRLSTMERQFTTTQESLSRVKIQLENYKNSLETAKLGLESRKNEKTKYEKDKADEEALVKKLQGENADLTGELLQLRTDFQTKLKENQAEVEKQLKGAKPLTRQASFIR